VPTKDKLLLSFNMNFLVLNICDYKLFESNYGYCCVRIAVKSVPYSLSLSEIINFILQLILCILVHNHQSCFLIRLNLLQF
jgi:hypothetical protein